jgi:hypothetical protein
MSSRRDSETVNTINQNYGSQNHMSDNKLGMNQFSLGSQTFDFQGAMNMIMGTQVPFHPTFMTAGGMNYKPQNLNFQNTANLRETVQANMKQINQTPNALSKILNALTKEHLKEAMPTSFTFPN